MSTLSQFKLDLDIKSTPSTIPPGYPLPDRVFIFFTINGSWAPGPREWLIFRAKFIPVAELTSISLSSNNIPKPPTVSIAASSDEVRTGTGNNSVSFRISAPTMRGIYRLQVSAIHSRPDNNNNGSILSSVGDAVSALIHVQEDRESRFRRFRKWLHGGYEEI